MNHLDYAAVWYLAAAGVMVGGFLFGLLLRHLFG